MSSRVKRRALIFLAGLVLLSPHAAYAAYALNHITPDGYAFVEGYYSNASPAWGHINDEFGQAIVISPHENFELVGISLPFWTRGNPEEEAGGADQLYSSLKISLYPGMAKASPENPKLIDLDNPLLKDVSPSQVFYLTESIQGPWYAYEVFFSFDEVQIDKTKNYTLTITNFGIFSYLPDGSLNPLCPNRWITATPAGGLSMRYFPYEDHSQGGSVNSTVFGPFSGPRATFALYKKDEQVAPLFRPVVFIHGMGGRPEDWDLGGNKEEYKLLIKSEWETSDPGFSYPDSWLHSFNYGLDGNGVYNYQGDVVEIAQELDPIVADLSSQHLAAGGDGKVDLVGFSLGGLVARRYLATKAIPMTEHYVNHVATIGTPHLGSWLMGLKEGIDRFPGVEGWVEDKVNSLLRSALDDYASDNGQPLDPTSTAAQQVTPGSDFLTFLNQGSHTPLDVEYNTFYGNIHATVRQNLFGVNFERSLSIGDGVILTESARSLAGVSPNEHAYESDVVFPLTLIRGSKTAFFQVAASAIASLRYFHTLLPRQANVQADVVESLF